MPGDETASRQDTSRKWRCDISREPYVAHVVHTEQESCEQTPELSRQEYRECAENVRSRLRARNKRILSS